MYKIGKCCLILIMKYIRIPHTPTPLHPYTPTPTSQIDVLGAALDHCNDHHIFVGMATGGGKTLAQLLLPLLSPEGVSPVTSHMAPVT